MHHRIKKQVLLLLVDAGLDAFALQQSASNFYWSKLLPVLERLFDELSPAGITIRLDRLELDLGRVTEGQLLGGAEKEELYVLLRRQIRDVLAGEGRSKGSMPGTSGEAESGISREPETGIFREPDTVTALRQWWYYMEHGRLHWGQRSVTDDWYRDVLESLAVDYAAIERLREVIRKEPGIMRRIAAQHGDVFLETLTGVLVGEKQQGLAVCVDAIVRMSIWFEEKEREASLSKPAVPKGAMRRGGRFRSLAIWRSGHAEFLSLTGPARKEALWRMVLRQGAATGPAFRAEGGAKQLAKWFWGGDAALVRWYKKEGLPLPAGASVLLEDAEKPVKKKAAKGERREAPGPEEGAGSDPDIRAETREESGAAAETKQSGERDEKEVIRDNEKEPESAGAPEAEEGTGEIQAGQTEAKEGEEALLFSAGEVDEEGIFLSNAGLVLLHPFLPTCFSRLGWWEDGQFTDTRCREKAVFLLHYLATGKQEAAEHELVFPKLLCGYSLEMVPGGTADLSDGEREEATTLLEMVLTRWEKLNDSSVEALRETFLQREGKLFRRNERMVLQVEAGPVDVLLDYLPWGLGIVKLPWMNEIIYTEWR